MNISKYGRDHCRVSLTKCPWDILGCLVNKQLLRFWKLRVHGFPQNLSRESDIQQSVTLGSLHLWQASAMFVMIVLCTVITCNYHVWRFKIDVFCSRVPRVTTQIVYSWNVQGFRTPTLGFSTEAKRCKPRSGLGKWCLGVLRLEMIIPERTDTWWISLWLVSKSPKDQVVWPLPNLRFYAL